MGNNWKKIGVILKKKAIQKSEKIMIFFIFNRLKQKEEKNLIAMPTL